GRSNAGKSSALNALCGGRFARAAKAPGRTRMINLFQLRGGNVLADLPGYGYAKVARAEQKMWGEKISLFLREPEVGGVVLVADARRGLMENDFSLLALAAHLPALVLLNKSDKLNRADMRQCAEKTRRALGDFSQIAVLPFSALKKTGTAEARAAVAALLNPRGNN
ncbi:MAG: ribosome biogenesis GTP-binding protein YsxC, partial [Betaproteobacteria bacterium]|nr:ribosome biogenesis GTP-binding protein YsxC [Betaproteobacteria bacterium]